MKKIDIIGKEIEIYKVKLLIFMAVAGGSWVYIFKLDVMMLRIGLLFVFFVVSYAIFTNIMKLVDLHMQLKGLKDD